MIFITLGSQKFQFNRLLIEIDRLIEEKKINENVFAQIGYSDYIPKHYKYKKFLDREEFSDIMESCENVITHGGTGAIIGAVKKGKKVIAIPRLEKFGEHVDNHQIEIVSQFKELGLIESVYSIDKLETTLKKMNFIEFNEYSSNNKLIIESIDEFIMSL